MSPDQLDEDKLDRLVAEVAAGRVTFDHDAPPPELPPKPDGEVMAVFSLRLSGDSGKLLADVAAKKGMKPSTLARQYVEMCLAAEEDDRLVSLTDVVRTLTQLRKPGKAA